MKLSRSIRHAGLSVGLALLMSVASTQTALGQDDPASTNGDIQAPQAVGSTAAAQPHSETYSPEEVRTAATKLFGSSRDRKSTRLNSSPSCAPRKTTSA